MSASKTFLRGLDDESRQLILRRYTWKAYLEAEETIKEKAEDMLQHYLAHIFPNDFKAQVVAVSRMAAIRYKNALDALLSNEMWLNRYVQTLETETQIKIDLKRVRKLKAEVVISGSLNDEPEIHKYTDEYTHDDIIERFKQPFHKAADDAIGGDVGIIIVQSMLLTGFDAPLEQVMYLDNVVREHNLLQTIARVNRVARNKYAGYVIDYVGVTKNLREALSNFENKDITEILEVVKDEGRELDELTSARSEIAAFFKEYGINNTNDVDGCVDVLADEDARDDFLTLFKKFAASMDKTLPLPEALKFTHDLKQYSFISQVARNRYRDEKLSIKDASKKIRNIVDEYLISRGVDPKIPPIPILSDKFLGKLKQEQSPRARAEELKHGIAEHISKHFQDDPELHERFGAMLERLLREYRDNWELLAKELEALIVDIRQGREAEENFGLDRRTEMPFLGLLRKEAFDDRTIQQLDQTDVDVLVQVTKDVLERLRTDISLVDFWNNITAQKKLKSWIASHLLTEFKNNRRVFSRRAIISQRIMELAYHIYG